MEIQTFKYITIAPNTLVLTNLNYTGDTFRLDSRVNDKTSIFTCGYSTVFLNKLIINNHNNVYFYNIRLLITTQLSASETTLTFEECSILAPRLDFFGQSKISILNSTFENQTLINSFSNNAYSGSIYINNTIFKDFISFNYYTNLIVENTYSIICNCTFSAHSIVNSYNGTIEIKGYVINVVTTSFLIQANYNSVVLFNGTDIKNSITILLNDSKILFANNNRITNARLNIKTISESIISYSQDGMQGYLELVSGSVLSIQDSSFSFDNLNIKLNSSTLESSGNLSLIDNISFIDSVLKPSCYQDSCQIHVFGITKLSLRVPIKINVPLVHLIDIKSDDFDGIVNIEIQNRSYINNTDLEYTVVKFSDQSISLNPNIKLKFEFSMTSNSSDNNPSTNETVYYLDKYYLNNQTFELKLKFVAIVKGIPTNSPCITPTPTKPQVETNSGESPLSAIVIAVVVSVSSVLILLIVVIIIYTFKLRKMRQTKFVKDKKNIEFLVFG
ncbi:hypothetical protein PPL_07825 [Heterostelium album PN500]|uniref:Uncharacterized protein n=1 Tax=Heterostelium pallidum (strain ATCC 26659 / Pp 5 / PN500) TaxID=670386 RepID=D3BH23_HETP5|nr:hypothetical protein PPL_07825 [Heterostelium album PN500]EFA79407.1 hypothetical protein PPL_07825 [Heterostelium album PN500]|eukprot:XP_020431528.1 hypothetical protein PPL_07825 [Heterostelium album PN500]